MLFEFADRLNDIDPLAFINKWDEIGQGLKKLLNKQYKSSSFYAGWPDEIESVFIPLKLFAQSKRSTNNETFNNATRKIIIHRQVNYFPVN